MNPTHVQGFRRGDEWKSAAAALLVCFAEHQAQSYTPVSQKVHHHLATAAFSTTPLPPSGRRGCIDSGRLCEKYVGNPFRRTRRSRCTRPPTTAGFTVLRAFLLAS